MKRDTVFSDLDLLKKKETMSKYDLIDFIKRDLQHNSRMAFSSMIHYIKGEINAYSHPDSINETEGQYLNKLSEKKARLVTLAIPGLKIIIREKLAGGADVKFIPVEESVGISQDGEEINAFDEEIEELDE